MSTLLRLFSYVFLFCLSFWGLNSLSGQTCGYSTGFGCSNTDYTNFGFNASSIDFESIEYDNYVSAFHSTIARTYDGSFKAWGEGTATNGSTTTGLIVPTTINSANGYNYVGSILKATMGSHRHQSVQTILLTYNGNNAGGLYAMGTSGRVLASNLRSNSSFGPVSNISNGNAYDLPGTLTPADVKMMFATYQTLAIVTCDGQAWVLSQITPNRGIGNNGNSTTWARVSTANNVPLQNVIAVRGTRSGMIALTYDGTNTNLYTWGTNTFLGNGSPKSQRTYATQMTAPGTGNIKMIGATSRGNNSTTSSNSITYYVLLTNGNLYSLGDNDYKQLGDWSRTDNGGSLQKTSWTRPTYTNNTGDVMNDIVWISPDEHDGYGFAKINVINEAGEIWNWGTNGGSQLGRLPANDNNDGPFFTSHPGQPEDIKGWGPPPYQSVETGGHTTMATRDCESNFGYVGHAVRGSSGDGTNQESYYSVLEYNTAGVHVCGASSDAEINIIGGAIVGSGGDYCSNQTIQLNVTPEGGLLELVSGPATLVGDLLTITGTGDVVVSYTLENTNCSDQPVTVTRTFATEACPLVNISGSVWVDVNGDAIVNPGENATNLNGTLYANLINAEGIVVASVPVNPSGTYTLPASPNSTYSIAITNQNIGLGTLAANTITPTTTKIANGWEYTGNSVGGNDICQVNPGPCPSPYTITDIVLGDNPINGYNFGVQQPPVTEDNDLPLVANPGGTENYNVPEGSFLPNDPDGDVVSITITEFPDNVTSITVGTTTYYPTAGDIPGDCTTCAVFPVDGITIPLDEDGNPTEYIGIDPLDGVTTVTIEYKTKDNAGAESGTSTVTIPFAPGYSIAGSVWHDPNGDAIVDTEEHPISGSNDNDNGNSTITGGTVYATLVDENNKVVASVQVNPDGTYSFDKILPGDYNIILTDTSHIVGDIVTESSLPEGWNHTGTNTNDTPQASNQTGIIAVTLPEEDINGFDFAIQMPPVANDVISEISQPDGGNTMTLSGLGQLPEFSGEDFEDGLYRGNDGTITNPTGAIINTLPDNGILLYNGVPVEPGQFVADPTLLAIHFEGCCYTAITFEYSYVDWAGQESEPAVYEIYWDQPLPVELSLFTVVQDECHAKIYWMSATEVNFQGYEVQKSNDGRRFESLTHIPAKGNNVQYAAADAEAKGLVYYRLKMTDRDNSVKYSQIKSVNIICNTADIAIFPTLTSDVLNIHGLTKGNMINIIGTDGKVVMQSQSTKDNQIVRLNNLLPGTYLVNVTTADGVLIKSEKVVKATTDL